MRTTNWPLITLGALCGCIVGRVLLPFIFSLPIPGIAIGLAMMFQSLCILGGAFLAVQISPHTNDTTLRNTSVEAIPTGQDGAKNTSESPLEADTSADTSPELPIAETPPKSKEAQSTSPPTAFQRFFSLYMPSCGMTVFQRIVGALVWAIILIVVCSICSTISQKALSTLGYKVAPQPLVETVTQNGLELLPLALFAFSSCILAPLAEELLFRRLLPETMTRFYMPELLAALISAILFAAAHEILWVFPGFFLLAMIQFHVAKKRDLLQCVLIHGFFNAGTIATLLLATLLLKNAA